ncbi:MAG: amidase [Thermodesulfobacteriota bacterium]
MLTFPEYEKFDALDLARLVKKGEVTPQELLEAAIERVEKHNPHINAVVLKMYDQARDAVKTGLPDGPLKGVPFLLKDLGVYYQGTPTSYGCRLFTDALADHDSELVIRYKKAGLVIFGKTNTPEFGLTVTTEPRLFGPCRNPWDTTRSCGGSSGGAAAAVASGIVPVAHASDGGGSIRIPASCCGLFGLKPTRGRISMAPDAGEGWAGMSIHHVISRTVRDSAAFLDATSAPVPGDPHWAPPPKRLFLNEVGENPGRLKIAFTSIPPTGVTADPECIKAVEETVKLCQKLGHTIEEKRPLIDQEKLGPAVLNIINASTLGTVERRLGELGRTLTTEDVETVTWHTVENGRKLSALDFFNSVQVIHRTARQAAVFFQDYDILLSPVLLKPPLPLGRIDMMSEDLRRYGQELAGYFGFTSLFNVTGQPSMSVPLYWTPENLPVGLQFTARFGEEALLFRLASQLESAQPWKERRPVINN